MCARLLKLLPYLLLTLLGCRAAKTPQKKESGDDKPLVVGGVFRDPPWRMIAGELLPNSLNPCASGTVCIFRDQNGHLQAQNTDNSLTQLAPVGPASLLTSTSSIGTLSITTQMDGPDSTSDYGIRYVHGLDATGTNRGPFNMVWNRFNETGPVSPSYVDNTFNLGWNCGGGGSYTSGQPSMCIALEQYFETGAPGVRQMEGHWIYNSPNGTQYRPISIEGHLDPDGTTGFTRMLMYNTQTNIGTGATAGDLNAHTQIALSSTTTLINSPLAGQSLTLDDQGNAVTLQSTDGVNQALVVLSPGNNGEARVQGGLVRLADTNGNTSYENDGSTTTVFDNTHDAFLNMNSSQISFFINSASSMVLQASQLFLYARYINLQRDSIGDGASPMGTALGYLARNTTAATSGTPVQMSPCSVWTSSAWNTTSVSAKDSSWSSCADPISGTQEIGRLTLGYSNDQANFITVGRLERDSNTSFGADGHFGAQGFQFDNSTAGFGTCDATHNRGTVRTVYGDSSHADLTKQCLKSATNTYSWVQIATGG